MSGPAEASSHQQFYFDALNKTHRTGVWGARRFDEHGQEMDP